MKNHRVWIGLVISLVFLGLLFWQIDLPQVLKHLKEADYIYIVPGVMVYFCICVLFRTLRWRLLLTPIKPISTLRLLPVVLVGYMANNVLPMRIGEIVRSYYLGKRENVSTVATLATIAIEKVLDGVILIGLLILVSIFTPVTGLVSNVATETNIHWSVLVLGTTVPFVGIMALMWIIANHPKTIAWVPRLMLNCLPEKFRAVIKELINKSLVGFEALNDSKRLSTIILISFPVWAGEIGLYYLVGLSFDLQSILGGPMFMIVAMIVVACISNLATAIPASQGSIGPFELFAVASLVVLGVDPEIATAYSLVLHLTLLLPISVAGLISLWLGNDSIKNVINYKSTASNMKKHPGKKEGSS